MNIETHSLFPKLEIRFRNSFSCTFYPYCAALFSLRHCFVEEKHCFRCPGYYANKYSYFKDQYIHIVFVRMRGESKYA